MSEYIRKQYTVDEESLQGIKEAREIIGSSSDSGAIRYCIRFTLEALKQRKEAS